MEACGKGNYMETEQVALPPRRRKRRSDERAGGYDDVLFLRRNYNVPPNDVYQDIAQGGDFA